MLVLLNFSDKEVTFQIDHPAVKDNYTELFTGNNITIKRKEDFNFGPGEYHVYHATSALP